jgi:prepilin-type N-terminal cleavage/methylation domain-containing protein
MIHRSEPVKRSGFTLLELLVVIAVLSIVSTMGFSALFKITGSWQTLAKRVALTDKADSIFETMRADFGQVISKRMSGISITGTNGEYKDSRFWGFDLENDQMLLPVGMTAPTIKRMGVSYAIDRSEGTLPQLTRTAGPLGVDVKLFDATPTPLADGVAAMSITYFDGRL